MIWNHHIKARKKQLLPKVNTEDFCVQKNMHNVIRKRKASDDDERIDRDYKFMRAYLNMLQNETDMISVAST
jgi:hypothetical protein